MRFRKFLKPYRTRTSSFREHTLYEAGGKTALTTMELNPNGTTTGRFYNLDFKKNYYFKFVSPNDYSVTGEGRLYKD